MWTTEQHLRAESIWGIFQATAYELKLKTTDQRKLPSGVNPTRQYAPVESGLERSFNRTFEDGCLCFPPLRSAPRTDLSPKENPWQHYRATGTGSPRLKAENCLKTYKNSQDNKLTNIKTVRENWVTPLGSVTDFFRGIPFRREADITQQKNSPLTGILLRI